MSTRPAGELCAGYEAMRVTAAGSVVSETPRLGTVSCPRSAGLATRLECAGTGATDRGDR